MEKNLKSIGNELIAEFMNWKKVNHDEDFKMFYIPKFWCEDFIITKECDILEPEEMLFTTSWDWLMPVIKKINNLSKIEEWNKFDFIIEPKQSSISVTFNYDGIHKKYISQWIEKYWLNTGGKASILLNSYQTIIEFIKWYNKKQIK